MSEEVRAVLPMISPTIYFNLILGIPLYAVCDVSEVGTNGATETAYSQQQDEPRLRPRKPDGARRMR